jgi:hypothetical protein
MSDDDAPAGKVICPAEVWGELDVTTRERVIEMFVGMAFRLVANQVEGTKDPGETLSEKDPKVIGRESGS